MTQRKEVFQSKVLQRLYPAPLKTNEVIPSCSADELAKRPCSKRKRLLQDVAQTDPTSTDGPAGLITRMYTALPCPPEYVVPQLENIQSSVEDCIPDSKEESDQDDDQGQQKRRRRRRKIKPSSPDNPGKELDDPINGSDQTPAGEGGERISRNKKRKLKKKRHKEKLLSLGLMPKAAALEFTYQRHDDDDDEEDDEQKKVARVSDFLRTTMEVYVSDPETKKVPGLSRTLEELLSDVVDGSRPPSFLQRLHDLAVLSQKKDGDGLRKAVESLGDNTWMTAEETTAVMVLFQYWITDILLTRCEKRGDQL